MSMSSTNDVIPELMESNTVYKDRPGPRYDTIKDYIPIAKLLTAQGATGATGVQGIQGPPGSTDKSLSSPHPIPLADIATTPCGSRRSFGTTRQHLRPQWTSRSNGIIYCDQWKSTTQLSSNVPNRRQQQMQRGLSSAERVLLRNRQHWERERRLCKLL